MRVATDRKVSPGRLRPQSWMAWATLLISLCATLLGWRFVVAYDRSLTESRFEARVGEAHATLNAYLVAHAQALRGAQAYVGASGQPSAGNWLRLYETMRIGENYPGFNGIAYLQAFTGEQREKTLAFLRLSHPDFTIRPPGERDFHVVVSTYEPSTPLNRKAIGADSWSNDERRRTLEAARDSGETRITGKVTLVMDKAEEKRPGFLMYQAVYIDGMLPTTVEARRQNLMGFVVAPFRIGALTDELFNAQHSDIALRIVDPLAPDDDPFFHITHGVLD